MSAVTPTALPIANLLLSRTSAQAERRRQFDQGAIAELAESIKTVGLLQPIVVRPVRITSTRGLNGFTVAGKDYMSPDAAEEAARDKYEVVAGERRLLAAKKAGLKEVVVSVRELTDEQVLEVQLIENLQRADVHPMAEAEGYEGLHRLRRSVEEIADKTKDRFGLVMVRGEAHRIVDIGMRMLTPRELFRAQSFSDDYIIDPIHEGKPLSKTAQVRMCGNSVPPAVAEALVRANVVERAERSAA